MYHQQKQTKKFFELDAYKWSQKASFKKKLFNVTHERNIYVLKKLKLFKSKSFLDVGCGSGDLAFEASKIVKNSIGIDFSSNMIKYANNNYNEKNLKFINENFFNFSFNQKFDLISANGFIEYLSLKDIFKFVKISKSLLNKNGVLIFGTRNRLFNLYSLNQFSTKEIKLKTFKNFYEESIYLSQLNFSNFIKLKKNKFQNVEFKQPKTGINVDKRHQFSPLQSADLMKKFRLKLIEFYPIHYHPIPPIKYGKSNSNNLIQKNFQSFSNYIYFLNEKNKLPFIPFSSSFMVAAKKLY